MTKLVFCCNQLEFTKEVEYPDDIEVTEQFVTDEVLKRVKPMLGASKLGAETSLYTPNMYAGGQSFDLYSTEIKMGNGVRFMSVWVRHLKDQPVQPTYA